MSDIDWIVIFDRLEAETLCRQKGVKHRFKTTQQPFNVFMDGPEVEDAMRLIEVTCAKCGWSYLRPALENVRAEFLGSREVETNKGEE